MGTTECGFRETFSNESEFCLYNKMFQLKYFLMWNAA